MDVPLPAASGLCPLCQIRVTKHEAGSKAVNNRPLPASSDNARHWPDQPVAILSHRLKSVWYTRSNSLSSHQSLSVRLNNCPNIPQWFTETQHCQCDQRSSGRSIKSPLQLAPMASMKLRDPGLSSKIVPRSLLTSSIGTTHQAIRAHQHTMATFFKTSRSQTHIPRPQSCTSHTRRRSGEQALG